MNLSILQLNINADNFWNTLIPFLKSNNFDVLNFQEMCGKNTLSGNINCKIDCFEELKNIFKDRYNSELAIAQRYTSSTSSYMGNAIFYKKEFKLLEKDILTLYKRTEPFPSELNQFEEAGRNLVHIKLKILNKTISFLNTHLAWAKTTIEQPHQTKQGELLVNYLRNLETSFVLTGDFNIDPKQPLVNKISALARNLVIENNTVTTLNPRTHHAKVLFPPGAAVDYIFVSNDIKVNKFEVLEKIDLSDHLALTTEIEI